MRKKYLLTERRCYILLTLLFIVPIWKFRLFPCGDNPTHQYNILLITHLLRDGAGPFNRYFELNVNGAGNFLQQLVMLALARFFEIPAAEKLFLTGYVIAFTAALRYAVKAVNPGMHLIAYAAFPLLYNWCFQMGFFNFLLSLTVLVALLGFYRSRRQGSRLRMSVWFLGFSLMLYGTHGLSLAMALLAAGVLAVHEAVTHPKDGGENGRAAADSRFPLLFLLAGAIPLGFYVLQEARTPTPSIHRVTLNFDYFLVNAKRLAGGAALASFSRAEFWLGRSFAAALALLSALCLAGRARLFRQGFFWVAVAFGAACLAAPNGWKSLGYLSARMGLYFYLSLLLWGAEAAPPAWAARAFAGVCCAISLALLGLQWKAYTALEPYVEEYVATWNHIESGATVLALDFLYRPKEARACGYYRVRPFLHLGDYVNLRAGAISLNNYEADTPHFWTRYRSGRNPYRFIAKPPQDKSGRNGLDGEPPEVEFVSYAERTGGSVDYVLLWGFPDSGSEDSWRNVQQQLQGRYRCVYASKGGLAALYRRLGAGGPGAQGRLASWDRVQLEVRPGPRGPAGRAAPPQEASRAGGLPPVRVVH
jgi:hypothetical protein